MKSVAIVGLGPLTKELCRNEPPESELWSLNQGHAVLPDDIMSRMTRWFQIHPWEEMVARQKPIFKHLEWLQNNTRIPVYLEQEHPEEVPMGVRYPREEVVADLGCDYFTSAIAYMMGLAIYEKFDKISLYGLEMAYGTEYFDQRPCLEYLGGLARGRGIELYVPESCPLFKGQRYASVVNIPSSKISSLMSTLATRKSHKKDEANALLGSLHFARELLANQNLQGDAHRTIGQEYERLLTDYKIAVAEFHAASGAEILCDQLLREALKDVPVDLDEVMTRESANGSDYHPELLPAGVSVTQDGAQ